MVRLMFASGPRAGQTIEIETEVSIGRSGTDIVLEDAELSRRHAILRPVPNGLYVEDLKSLNGTHVDGRALAEPLIVPYGAVIQVGQTQLRVEHPQHHGATTVRNVADGHTRVRPQARLDATGIRPVRVPGALHLGTDGAVPRDGTPDPEVIARVEGVSALSSAPVEADGGAEIELDGGAAIELDGGAAIELDGGAAIQIKRGAAVQVERGAAVEVESGLAVQVEHLTLSRGGRPVLNDLSLTLQVGEVAGLLGPSGAGKTSLIRSIAGVQSGILGSVKVFGRDPTDPAVRRDLGYVTQAPSVYADLTVVENLRYFAAIKQEPCDGLLERVGLTEQRGQLVRELSGGQRARVSLAAALIGRPRLLLLDEPTVGLDPLLRRELWDLFADLAAEGSTLLVSSHVLDEARHCQSLLLIRQGRLLAQLTPAELIDRSGTMDLEESFIRLIGES